jgi:hypothetical protein
MEERHAGTDEGQGKQASRGDRPKGSQQSQMDGARTTLIRDNLTNGDAMNLSAGPRYQP